MPLFDDIFSQPAILISVGFAFLFIVAAIVLAVLPRIKASRARAQRRKVAAEAARAEQAAIEEEEQAVAQAARRSGKRRAAAQTHEEEEAAPAAKGGKSSAPVAPIPTAAAVAPVPSAPAAAKPASPLVSTTTTTTTSTKEDEVSPEMQDLLSSVFSDEENSERQAILLKGMQPVAIDELLTLSKSVAAQLRGEQPSNIVRVKETELS
ncbi:MAG: hypothetical protein GC179_16820 [Anaerolineaceae bacterium]|nr:hypothetical protein [Anaerolineaceae bacterium]